MAKARWCPRCRSILRDGVVSGDHCDKHRDELLVPVPHSELFKKQYRVEARGTAVIPDGIHCLYPGGNGGKIAKLR